MGQLTTDLLLESPKSEFYTVRLEQVQSPCFSRQAHGSTLVRTFFGFWSPKSDKQWKVLRDCLENSPTEGSLGNQTFPWGCAPRESLITLGTSLGQILPDNHFGLSTVCTSPTFLWTVTTKKHAKFGPKSQSTTKHRMFRATNLRQSREFIPTLLLMLETFRRSV